MNFFMDGRPVSHTLEGYLFGALGGAACGCALGVSGVGRAAVVPMMTFFAIQIGAFETILASDGAKQARTAEFDPGKWGGAVLTSCIAAMGSLPGMPTAARPLRTVALLTIAGTASITSYAHVVRIKDVAIGELNTGMLGIDVAACAATALANSACMSRLRGRLGRAPNRAVLFLRGAMFLAVPALTVDALERTFQR